MTADPWSAFLAARLDEDEAAAERAAACGRVQRDGFEPGDWSRLLTYGQPQPDQVALIDHQARFDPARVLRDVAARREILAMYAKTKAITDRIEARGTPAWELSPADLRDWGDAKRELCALEPVIEALAGAWDGHPGYPAGSPS